MTCFAGFLVSVVTKGDGEKQLPKWTVQGLMNEMKDYRLPRGLITRCNALYLSDKEVDEHRSYAINVAPLGTECKR